MSVKAPPSHRMWGDISTNIPITPSFNHFSRCKTEPNRHGLACTQSHQSCCIIRDLIAIYSNGFHCQSYVVLRKKSYTICLHTPLLLKKCCLHDIHLSVNIYRIITISYFQLYRLILYILRTMKMLT